MSINHIFRFAIAGLVATQVPILSAQTTLAQSTASVASFECLTQGTYATVAVKKDGAVSDPIIVWSTGQFSESGYTPERRCQEVKTRLNNALSQNGGTLSGLYITAGRVNGMPVLCAVNNKRGGCNENNMLFTLKKENNPNRVLETMNTVSGSGTPMQESGGQPYVDLEQLVNRLF